MSTSKRIWTGGLYWGAVAMSLGCFALVLAGNTETVWRFEHVAFPLSWTFGIAAMVAFLAAEFFHPASSLPSRTADLISQPSPEWEAAEF